MLLPQGARARPAAEEETGLGPMVQRYGGRGRGGGGVAIASCPHPTFLAARNQKPVLEPLLAQAPWERGPSLGQHKSGLSSGHCAARASSVNLSLSFPPRKGGGQCQS